jgi:endonuclease-3 related protein
VSISLIRVYERLLEAYGPRGWWPLQSRAGHPGFDGQGYHPGEYGCPGSPQERFEIAMGAVLTQNTSWRNAAKALSVLLTAGIRTPAAVLSLPERQLAESLRSSGYYNQKARKLRALSMLLADEGVDGGWKTLSRDALLAVWGIGPESADSILLYACGRLFFVVDAYTCRLLERLGVPWGNQAYAEVQAAFSAALPPDPILYQEYHALVVQHAKQFCRKQPLCRGCPLLSIPCTCGAAFSG